MSSSSDSPCPPPPAAHPVAPSAAPPPWPGWHCCSAARPPWPAAPRWPCAARPPPPRPPTETGVGKKLKHPRLPCHLLPAGTLILAPLAAVQARNDGLSMRIVTLSPAYPAVALLVSSPAGLAHLQAGSELGARALRRLPDLIHLLCRTVLVHQQLLGLQGHTQRSFKQGILLARIQLLCQTFNQQLLSLQGHTKGSFKEGTHLACIRFGPELSTSSSLACGAQAACLSW